MSRNQDFLFRAVPPSLFLALAMTEGEEKRERMILMEEHNCSELEAAFHVAEQIDRARGIQPMPWKHLFSSQTDAASEEVNVTEGLEDACTD